jgi:hypothetical protein
VTEEEFFAELALTPRTGWTIDYFGNELVREMDGGGIECPVTAVYNKLVRDGRIDGEMLKFFNGNWEYACLELGIDPKDLGFEIMRASCNKGAPLARKLRKHLMNASFTELKRGQLHTTIEPLEDAR